MRLPSDFHEKIFSFLADLYSRPDVEAEFRVDFSSSYLESGYPGSSTVFVDFRLDKERKPQLYYRFFGNGLSPHIASFSDDLFIREADKWNYISFLCVVSDVEQTEVSDYYSEFDDGFFPFSERVQHTLGAKELDLL